MQVNQHGNNNQAMEIMGMGGTFINGNLNLALQYNNQALNFALANMQLNPDDNNRNQNLHRNGIENTITNEIIE